MDAFVSKFVEVLANYAKEEAILLLGVSDEIERLRRTLQMMQDVLADAERRQFEEAAINRWLSELRDAMYDADDIIDQCSIEAGKKHAQSPSSSLQASRCCYSAFACFRKCGFRHRIGKRIKSLNRRLEEINARKGPFNLAPAPSRDDSNQTRVISPKTSSMVDPCIVGEKIEDATRSLVQQLITSRLEAEQQHKIRVIAIVGMGGVGKTTLAQRVCNDEALLTSFSPIKPVWLCVSTSFDPMKLLRDIIRGVGGNPGDAKDAAELEPLLSEAVSNKKILLVLDDVWDAKIWEDYLRKPLQSAGTGTRILVTTRLELVARRMGAVHQHRVEKLSDDDCWLLLCKMVLFESGEEGQMLDDLRDVGMRIVKRCDGLPLAVKAVAGVLRTKERRPSDWEKVLRDPAWSAGELHKDIVGALYLSFEDLRPQLKQCFIYFSLFPEDAVLQRGTIVALWMAEGFVGEKGGELTIEEVGEGYWNELVQRSLLEPVPIYFDNGGCKMHDLVRSLTQHLAQNENYCGGACQPNGGTISSSPMKLRRLYIQNDQKEETTRIIIPNMVRDATSLRTLICEHDTIVSDHDLKQLRRLRVLKLNNLSMTKLPCSIGNLVHMRYLDLSGSKITEIPESIGNLKSLQCLDLEGCRALRSLPMATTSLINLRLLNVFGTQLDSMPAGIGRLIHLRDLWGFVLSTNIGRGGGAEQSTLEELKLLSQIRILGIEKLERVSSEAEARAASLTSKQHLINLNLQWTSHSPTVPATCNEEEERRIKAVLSELCPPPSLERLLIDGYFGLGYPSWMMEMRTSSLPCLRWLQLENCQCCPLLPPLGRLHQLQTLWITGASAVVSLGPKFFLGNDLSAATSGGTRCIFFPKLEYLTFEEMPNWIEWGWSNDRNMVLLPRLTSLTIQACPMLRSLPESLLRHATKLEEVRIIGAHSMREIKNLPSQQLIVSDNRNLERVSDLPALGYLHVRECRALRDVHGLDALRILVLEDEDMESLPEWLLVVGGELRFPLLQKLDIVGSILLLSRCIVDGADWHKIRDIPRVEAKSRDGSVYIAYTKSPRTFATNLSDYPPKHPDA